MPSLPPQSTLFFKFKPARYLHCPAIHGAGTIGRPLRLSGSKLGSFRWGSVEGARGSPGGERPR